MAENNATLGLFAETRIVEFLPDLGDVLDGRMGAGIGLDLEDNLSPLVLDHDIIFESGNLPVFQIESLELPEGAEYPRHRTLELVAGRVEKTPNIVVTPLEFLLLYLELAHSPRHLIVAAGDLLVQGEETLATTGVTPC